MNQSRLSQLASIGGAPELANPVQELERLVAELRDNVLGIQTIGAEMHRIALNATIQAARLGHDGSALEIVADSVQRLAREAGAASSTVEDRLGNIRDAALALDKTATRGDSAAQIPQLSRSAAGLNSIQDQARDGYAQSIGKIAGLKGRIDETIAEFGDQSGVLERLVRAAGLLRRFSDDGQPAAASDVERMAAIYTMQSERDVHQGLLDADGSQGRRAPRPGAVESSDGQDDNVEFF